MIFKILREYLCGYSKIDTGYLPRGVTIDEGHVIKGNIHFENNGLIQIGKGFIANSGDNHNPVFGDLKIKMITPLKNSSIRIGDNVGMSNCTLFAYDSIIIEDNVMIGGGVNIWDTDFHPTFTQIRDSRSEDLSNVSMKPVHIKRNAFIGALSIILKGVIIGENSIIGAGSVVSQSIPDNVVAAGNPCQVIRAIN